MKKGRKKRKKKGSGQIYGNPAKELRGTGEPANYNEGEKRDSQ